MANENIYYKIGFGGGAPEIDTKMKNYSAAFQPIVTALNKQLQSSLTKTQELLEKMPNGIAIDKVPEELRAQTTEFLTKYKNEYARAAQIVATAFPNSKKYQEAIEVMNSVKTKFENLNTSMTALQLSTKNSLETVNDLAGSVTENDRLDHSNFANGEVYKTFSINEDGYATYVGADGETKRIIDYKGAFIDDGNIIKDYLTLTESAYQYGKTGRDFNESDYRLAIEQMFRVNGKDRVLNFAYEGVKTGSLLDDSQQVEFIHQYIYEKTGKKPGDEGYDQVYEEYKTDDGLIDAFGDHLLDVIKGQYYDKGFGAYNEANDKDGKKNNQKNIIQNNQQKQNITKEKFEIIQNQEDTTTENLKKIIESMGGSTTTTSSTSQSQEGSIATYTTGASDEDKPKEYLKFTIFPRGIRYTGELIPNEDGTYSINFGENVAYNLENADYDKLWSLILSSIYRKEATLRDDAKGGKEDVKKMLEEYSRKILGKPQQEDEETKEIKGSEEERLTEYFNKDINNNPDQYTSKSGEEAYGKFIERLNMILAEESEVDGVKFTDYIFSYGSMPGGQKKVKNALRHLLNPYGFKIDFIGKRNVFEVRHPNSGIAYQVHFNSWGGKHDYNNSKYFVELVKAMILRNNNAAQSAHSMLKTNP
tara:strand:- start:1757 stop:3697 length:1941 start_codon:yes stop_codon:yes gene_type:complete